MADKTDEDIATEIHEAASELNKLTVDAAKVGLRVALNTTTINRVGSPAIDILDVDVSRAFPKRTGFENEPKADDNG